MSNVFDSIGLGKEEIVSILPELGSSELAYVTGSLVTCRGTADSDVDVIVICEDNRLSEHISKSVPRGVSDAMIRVTEGFENKDRAPMVHFWYGPRLVDLTFHSWTRIRRTLRAVQSSSLTVLNGKLGNLEKAQGDLFFSALLCKGIPVWNDELLEKVKSSLDIGQVFWAIAQLQANLASKALSQAQTAIDTGQYISAYFYAEQALLNSLLEICSYHNLLPTNNSWIFASLEDFLGINDTLVKSAWDLSNKQIAPTSQVQEYVAEVANLVHSIAQTYHRWQKGGILQTLSERT